MQQRGRTASSSTSSSAYRFRGSSGQQGGEAENSPRSDRTQVSRLHELRYGTGSSQEVGGEAAEGALKNIISGSADVTGANAGSTTQIQTSEIVQGHSSGGTSVSRKQQYFYSYSSQQQQSSSSSSRQVTSEGTSSSGTATAAITSGESSASHSHGMSSSAKSSSKMEQRESSASSSHQQDTSSSSSSQKLPFCNAPPHPNYPAHVNGVRPDGPDKPQVACYVKSHPKLVCNFPVIISSPIRRSGVDFIH